MASISEFLDNAFGRRGGGTGLPSASEFRQVNSSLKDLSRGIHGIVDQLSKAAKQIDATSSATEKAAFAQAMMNKEQEKGAKATGELTEQLEELNDSYRETAEAADEAGGKFNDTLQKGRDFLSKYGIELGRLALIAKAYTMQLEGARRVQENISRGGGNLGGGPRTFVEAHKAARDLKVAYDEVSEAAVDVGFSQEEGFNVASRAMDRLGYSYKDLADPAKRRELAAFTQDVLTLSFALGQDVSNTQELVETYKKRFGITSRQARREMYLIRGDFDELRSRNKNLTLSSEEYTAILSDAITGTKNYATDLTFLSNTLSRVTEETYRMTGSQKRAVKAAKDVMGIFEEPPAWMDVTVMSRMLNKARTNLNAFVAEMGAEGQRGEIQSILEALSRGELDDLQAMKLMGQSLRGTRGYNKAILTELRAAGGTKNVRQLQALTGLDETAAFSLFKQLKDGNFDIESSLSKQREDSEAIANNYKESAKALKDAGDQTQGFGNRLESILRNDYVLAGLLGVSAIGGLRMAAGGLRGLGGGITNFLGRMFGRGGAGGARGTGGNPLVSAAAAAVGGNGDCVPICGGGDGGGLDGLSDHLEDMKDALGGDGGGGKGKGKSKGRRGGGRKGRMRSRLASFGRGLGKAAKFLGPAAGAASLIFDAADIGDIVSDVSLSSEDKTMAISDVVGEAGLAMATLGVSPLIQSVLGETYASGKKAVVSGLADSMFKMTHSRKYSSGSSNQAQVQDAAKRGVNFRQKSTTAQGLMSDIIWNSDGTLKPEFAWVAKEFGGKKITDEMAQHIIGRALTQQMAGMSADDRGRVNTVANRLVGYNPRMQQIEAMRNSFGGAFSNYAQSEVDLMRAAEQHRMIKSLRFEKGKLDNQGRLKGKAEYVIEGFGSAVNEQVDATESHRKRAGVQ